MKKLLALLLALVMCLSLAACGGTASNPDEPQNSQSSTPESNDPAQNEAPSGNTVEPFVVGFPEAPVDVPAVKAIKINTDIVAQAGGGTMNNEVFDFTPEGTVDAVEKMIANGVQGIKITPSSDSIIPTIAQMCEESGVYFILSMRTIADEDVMALCEANPYFLGCVYADDYAIGYALGKALYDTGKTTYALIGTAVGDTTGDTRERGLAAAAEEFGLTQVAEVRALEQASDATAAVESFLASYPDLGGIVRVASTAAGDVLAVCAALEESGRGGDVKFISIDSDNGCDEYFEKNILTATLGNENSIDSFIATVLLVNAVCGTPLTDEPVDICINAPVITTLEDLVMDSTYVIGEDGLYPAEYIQQHFLKFCNAELTYDDLLAELDLYSPSYIASLWN